MEMTEQQKDALRRNTFSHYNFFELEQASLDYAVYKLEIRPESRNSYGMVHGGALYSMADNAAGTAAHSDGRHYVTQTGSLNFLDNRPSGIIRAAARVVRRGDSTVFVNVEITGEDGGLLATGSFVFHRVGQMQNF